MEKLVTQFKDFNPVKENQETPVRGYHRSSKAVYSHVVSGIEVMFGMYYLSGGCQGEMKMVWETLGGQPTASLECYDDGWYVLSTFTDVITKLGQHRAHIDEDGFCAILDECGFKDLTKY